MCWPQQAARQPHKLMQEFPTTHTPDVHSKCRTSRRLALCCRTPAGTPRPTTACRGRPPPSVTAPPRCAAIMGSMRCLDVQSNTLSVGSREETIDWRLARPSRQLHPVNSAIPCRDASIQVLSCRPDMCTARGRKPPSCLRLRRCLSCTTRRWRPVTALVRAGRTSCGRPTTSCHRARTPSCRTAWWVSILQVPHLFLCLSPVSRRLVGFDDVSPDLHIRHACSMCDLMCGKDSRPTAAASLQAVLPKPLNITAACWCCLNPDFSPLQVVVQLTVRLQGSALLGFTTAAAAAVLAALQRQSDSLSKLQLTLQELDVFACPDPRRQGVGCRLSPQQLAAGERPFVQQRMCYGKVCEGTTAKPAARSVRPPASPNTWDCRLGGQNPQRGDSRRACW